MEDFKKEIMRKSLHLWFGALFTVLVYFGFLDWRHFLAVSTAGIILVYYMKKTGRKVAGISLLIDFMGREKEYPGIGAVTFVIGIFLATFLFSKEIAASSILILAVGDSVSPIVGTHFGKTKTWLSQHKKLEGFIAGVIMSFLAAAPIVGYNQAFFGSLFAMLAEIADITGFIDDNILMPLVAGIVMSVL